MKPGYLLRDLLLNLLRAGQSPELVEGIHIEGQIIEPVLIAGHRHVDIAVEIRELIDIIPDQRIAGMENVRPVFMNVDIALPLGIDISGHMIPFVDHDAAAAVFLRLMGKYSSEQAGPDNQVVVFPPFLQGFAVLFRLAGKGIYLLLPGQVGLADRLRFPAHQNLAVVQPEGVVAETLYGLNVVGDVQKSRPAGQHLLHTVLAAAFESLVAHGQDLVHDQDFGIHHGGYREAQAGLHAGGEVLDRGIQELPDLREINDLVEMFFHILPGMSQHRAVQKNVLPGCHLRVKTGAELDHGRDLAAHLHSPLVRLQNPGDRLKKGGFTGAVDPDQSPGFSFFYMQIHILQSHELLEHELMLDHLDRIFLQVRHLLAGKVEADRHMVHIDYIFRHILLPEAFVPPGTLRLLSCCFQNDPENLNAVRFCQIYRIKRSFCFWNLQRPTASIAKAQIQPMITILGPGVCP